MRDIIVEVTKGMVTGLYCDIEDARFIVVDWDLLERSDSNTQLGIEQDHAELTSLPTNTRLQYQNAVSP